MRTRWLRWTLVPLAALAAAEIGHFISYSARLGPGALAAQSSGGHFYLPALFALLTGSAGLVLLLALFLIGLARGSSPPTVSIRRISVLNLASLLLLAQLAIYGLQEALEAAAAGQALQPGADLAFWGILGQLPAALIAALILSRLLARVEAAIGILAAAPERLSLRGLSPVRATAGKWVPPARPPRHTGAATLRGPPAPV